MKWRKQVEGNMRIGLRKDNEDAVDWCRKSCKSRKMHPATYIQWKNLTELNWIVVVKKDNKLKFFGFERINIFL